MATTDGTSGSRPVTASGTVEPAGRTAAQQRADKAAAGSPEALAREIEQTREDLAETLDAIAEKVSPKRVAKRTSQKAAATAKETAAQAKVAVASGAVTAKEALTAGAATAKEALSTGAATAKVAVSGGAATAREAVSGGAVTAKEAVSGGAATAKEALATGAASVKEVAAAGKDKLAGRAAGGDAPVLAVLVDGDAVADGAAAELVVPVAELPPVTAVEVPELGTLRPGAATSRAPLRTTSTGHPQYPGGALPVKKEYVAAAAAGLALVLLAVSRRRGR